MKRTYFIIFILSIFVNVNAICIGNHNRQDNSDPVHGKILKTKITKKDRTTYETTCYADGYVKIVINTDCFNCRGSGKCIVCGGSGVNMFGYQCTMCVFTHGNCQQCKGSGKMVKVTGAYPNKNVGTYSGGGRSGTDVNSGSNGTGSKKSTYINCKYCGGTGRCSSCNGKGYKFNSYSGHNNTCPGCFGKGSCRICYGSGRL